LGEVALRQGDFDAANEAFAADLASSRALGDKGGIVIALYNLGNAARGQGALARASTLYEQCLAALGDFGWPYFLARVRAGLGQTALRQGDHERAAAHFGEALALLRHLGDRRDAADTARCLAGLAAIAAKQVRRRRPLAWPGQHKPSSTPRGHASNR
jgi:tetratricopeptide (TPR) repeat protein